MCAAATTTAASTTTAAAGGRSAEARGAVGVVDGAEDGAGGAAGFDDVCGNGEDIAEAIEGLLTLVHVAVDLAEAADVEEGIDDGGDVGEEHPGREIGNGALGGAGELMEVEIDVLGEEAVEEFGIVGRERNAGDAGGGSEVGERE